MAKKYDIIKPALGFYPTRCIHVSEEEFDAELKFISEQDIIAIGEVGLDYKKTDENPVTAESIDKMKKCFQKIIDLTEKKNIPIIIHSRKAELDCIEMLEKSNLKKDQIIMHCFMGRKHLVKRVIDNGWSLSIPTIVNKLQQLQENVANTPMSQLLTETDAPYMSPYPNIRRNEPRFIIESIKKIAEIKNLDPEEVKKMIFMNYQRVF